MFWAIVLIGIGVFLGYLLWGSQARAEETRQRIVRMRAIPSKVKNFRETITSREKWIIICGLALLEIITLFIILPSLAGSMVRAQAIGGPGSTAWFWAWLWRTLWFVAFCAVAIMIPFIPHRMAKRRKELVENALRKIVLNKEVSVEQPTIRRILREIMSREWTLTEEALIREALREIALRENHNEEED